MERKYLCLQDDNHTPETQREIESADNGICPFCGGEMIWEDYDADEEPLEMDVGLGPK